VVTASEGLPRSVAAADLRGYFAAHPQEYYALRGILAPIGDAQRQCDATLLSPDLASAYDEFMAANRASPVAAPSPAAAAVRRDVGDIGPDATAATEMDGPSVEPIDGDNPSYWWRSRCSRLLGFIGLDSIRLMALDAVAAEVRAVLAAARRLVGSAPQHAELSADTERTVAALEAQQHDVAAGHGPVRGHNPMACGCRTRHQRPREWRAPTSR
jgi:Haemophore, haem-binding